MKPHKHIPLNFKRMSPAEQMQASREFVERMSVRRSVRFMSSEPVPFELIENAVRCASLAPSGANQQPWKFVVVKDPMADYASSVTDPRVRPTHSKR
jgi:iodotyrosine deiodinase